MSTPLLMVIGAVLGVIVEHLSHRRSAAQPLAQDQNAEQRLLNAAEQHPGLAAAVNLPADTFSLDAHRTQWGVLQQHTADDISIDDTVTRDAATVQACFDDREAFPSRTIIFEANGRLHRLPPAVGMLRRFLAGVFTAVGFFLAADVFTGVALIAACVVVLTALVIALVDIDTLLIDLTTYLVGYGTAIGLLITDAIIAGDSGRIWPSLALGVGSAAGLFLFIVIYSRLRNMQAMGFGDVLLYGAAGTVALLATSNPWVLYNTLLLGAAAGFVTWVCIAITYRGTMRKLKMPFPFGPGLALGAFLAMVLV